MAGHGYGCLSFLLPLSSRENSLALWTVVEPARRFPPPWSVEEGETYFVVKDNDGQALADVHFDDPRFGTQAAHPQ
jgi:hypothetical protein